MKPRILIAEDQPLMRRSVRTICYDEGFKNMREVDSCRELLAELAEQPYSHLVLDLTLADGSAMEELPKILTRYPALRVMVYSSKPSKLYADFIRSRYRVRFISKGAEEFEAVNGLLDFLSNKPDPHRPQDEVCESPFDLLSPKERSILPYMLAGWSLVDIAAKSDTSPATVRNQKANILRKTGATNLLELKELAELYGFSFDLDA